MVMTSPFANLAAAYAWLNSQIDYERILGAISYDGKTFELEGFRRRLAGLGEPQRGLRTIHIAGTRGKGSAALALEALLEASGLRTAVFTSPHLHEYRERVRIGGESMGAELFAALLGEVAGTGTAGGRPESEPGGDSHGFKTVFEHLTALFFLAARRLGVDWAIVETGLGGRLDATNVLDPGPVLLTRIGLEHTHLLGDTIGKIAGEKAAILKRGGWGVAAAQEPGGEAGEVFAGRAAGVGARLDAAPELCPIRRLEAHRGGLRLEIGFEGRLLALELPLFGEFHAENLQNALALLSRLRGEGLVPRVADARLVEALVRLRLPGRMERVCAAPELFADGGHCPTAARALARAMAAHFGQEPAGLLVGMMEEKDHAGFFRELAGWGGWRWVGCYRVASPRAAEPAKLAQAALSYFCNTVVYENLDMALEFLAKNAEEQGRVVATGSLYSIDRLQQWGSSHGSAKPQIQTPAQIEPHPDH